MWDGGGKEGYTILVRGGGYPILVLPGVPPSPSQGRVTPLWTDSTPVRGRGRYCLVMLMRLSNQLLALSSNREGGAVKILVFTCRKDLHKFVKAVSTDHIRRMGEGNVLTGVGLSVHREVPEYVIPWSYVPSQYLVPGGTPSPSHGVVV